VEGRQRPVHSQLEAVAAPAHLDPCSQSSLQAAAPGISP
jgi:hypothetical protein